MVAVGSATGYTGSTQVIWKTKPFRSLKSSRKNFSAPIFLLLHFGHERVFVPTEPAETMGQKDLAIQRHWQEIASISTIAWNG
jgi:hypothetical protein